VPHKHANVSCLHFERLPMRGMQSQADDRVGALR
jgi:hypothetical protein